MQMMKFIMNRKILVSLLTVLIIFLGAYSITKLDRELFPDVTMDGAYVDIRTEDMQAADVERTITTPLEQKLMAIEGVEKVESTSYVGSASFFMNFEKGKGDDIYKEVESLVASETATLPNIHHTETGQYGTQQNYEYFMDLSGGDMETMSSFATTILEPRLEALKEVRDVSLTGLFEQELSVSFDQKELTAQGIDVTQVISTIEQANKEATLGTLEGEEQSPSLRWNTTLQSVEEVKQLEIPTENGSISLQDIADVTIQPLESSSFVWKNGTKELVFVQVGGTSDYTQIETANAIRSEINQIKEEELVKGFQVNEIVSPADYVEDSINSVTKNIIIGGAIAIVVLLLFLRNVRATFIIGLSIPTSILLTFATIWLLDYSLNMLTLIALGLGIGMMVDSSIVILESIYRKKQDGLGNRRAVLEGTKEVATAVIASMLTTIVVFVPIGLLGGEMGTFMILLSVVVAVTLVSSVIVSFTLIPSLSEKFLQVRHQKGNKKEGALLRLYGRVVKWTVEKKRRSLAVILIFLALFGGSLALIPKVPMTIMPDIYNRYSEIAINLESGIDPEQQENIVKDINERLSTITDVESNYVIDNNGLLYTLINMTKGNDITTDQQTVKEDILAELRSLEKDHPIKNVQDTLSSGGGNPVQVEITGEEFGTLKSVSNQFMERLETIDGIVGIHSSVERSSLEEVVELKEDNIQEAGLTNSQIQASLQQSFLDTQIDDIHIQDTTIPIMARWDQTTTTKKELLNSTILTQQGEKKLSDFVSFTSVPVPNEISHVDGERLVTISADIENSDLGTINREVEKAIESFNPPEEYTITTAGDLEQQQELFQEMLIILGVALFLVYLVMAVQFNHLLHPIIVMSVIPMTFVGVIVGLFATQRELSVMSGMGVIMLIGIVLNNAILFIDRTNQLRNHHLPVSEALVEAGKNRIRPIFMTSLTTAGGMLPLALATGTTGNYQAPMATVIISGIMFATFITLLLIPAVYRLFTRKEQKQLNEGKKQDKTELQESAM
ncbi:efflux RND transporter permease subunit [Pontibacillus salicampi]|uniref:Efflux RND transporter permease subunit n=1 Tax=Pontibacillus salicampi TaxID=1449801 RepID=A0ABV6LQH8_9BACI